MYVCMYVCVCMCVCVSVCVRVSVSVCVFLIIRRTQQVLYLHLSPLHLGLSPVHVTCVTCTQLVTDELISGVCVNYHQIVNIWHLVRVNLPSYPGIQCYLGHRAVVATSSVNQLAIGLKYFQRAFIDLLTVQGPKTPLT